MCFLRKENLTEHFVLVYELKRKKPTDNDLNNPCPSYCTKIIYIYQNKFHLTKLAKKLQEA